MKATYHKSCSCSQCKRGRNRYCRNLNERKLRRLTREQLIGIIKGNEDAFIAPISSPYTD
jgi:Zn-dependent alcohol dehydrogenase